MASATLRQTRPFVNATCLTSGSSAKRNTVTKTARRTGASVQNRVNASARTTPLGKFAKLSNAPTLATTTGTAAAIKPASVTPSTWERSATSKSAKTTAQATVYA
eukprot:CAMPEP_0116992258 /NCGR_PEP_ID=MMETSP0467-20121206/66685_1 /TAXON_ID=283647 /ORGANISM="Mesodinium pulex, Strain SPMC105" /LENGTH=104 /DNA_ID=CAMNT_0004689615 /DNA_START=2735 /DNA_END=3049 /DNA_ORIENTATION=+